MRKYIIIVLSLIVTFSCANSVDEHLEEINGIDTLVQTLSEETIFEDTSTVNGITFSVDDVEIAPEPMNTDSAIVVITNRLEREISYMPSTHENRQIARTRIGNGFISTVHECYDNHRPLILGPDDIWLAICQGVAIHIKENFDSLEQVIFKADHPDELVARNDSLEYDADQWDDLIADLSDQTIEYSKQEVYDFFVPEFSTTEPITTTVYQITLLESFEKAFTYVGDSGCGIPSIHLDGYQKDWLQIYMQLDQLDEFGLTEWKDVLKPVIAEFIQAYNGKVNSVFWQDIYKDATEYGAFYISGWIIKFFPYLSTTDDYDYEADFDEDMGGYRTGISYKPNPYLKGTDYLMSKLTTDDFPGGISKINLKWNNYLNGETKEMVINGGFFGMEQFDDKSVKPFISWVIHEKDAAIPAYKNLDYAKSELEHQDDFWSPKLIANLEKPAIYDADTFTDQVSSLLHVKTVLKEAVVADAKTTDADLTGLAVGFVVLINGEVTRVTLKGKGDSNADLIQVIEKTLKNLPHAWSPAMADSEELLLVMPGNKNSGPKNIVKANSFVGITF